MQSDRDRHDVEIEQKASELARLEHRISEARELLSDAHAATERERAQRAALEERLQALSALTLGSSPQTAPPRADDEAEHADPAEDPPVPEPGAHVPVPDPPTFTDPEAEETSEPEAEAKVETPTEQQAHQNGHEAPDAQPTTVREVVEAKPAAHDFETVQATAVAEPFTGSPAPKRSRFGRRRKAGRAFIDRPGKCLTCSTEYEAENEKELAASGWIVQNDDGVCPDCQSNGWRFPEGATLPYRSGNEG
jgi:hypothetical protein